MSHRRLSLVLVLTALAVADVAVYARMLGHRFVSYDTAIYVYENPRVRDGFSVDSIAWAFDPRHNYAGNWHPLTWLSHMLDCQVFGIERPGGHLAVNLALHVVNTWLLFLALWMLARRALPPAGPGDVGAMDLRDGFWQSALVAALFGVHPLHVESVAWVAERKDVLSGLFWMLTLLAYAWYAARPSARRMAAVGVALALGLMSKPMLVTLPFVLVLLDCWPLARLTFGRGVRSMVGQSMVGQSMLTQLRPLIIEKIPLFALSVGASAVTFVVQKQAGAVNAALPLTERVLIGVWAQGMYLLKTFWPHNMACFYPRTSASEIIQQHPMELAGAALMLIGVTALAVIERQRRPYLLVGWLWYLGTMVPVSGVLVQVGEQSMADRYTYIPLIGVFIMLAWGIPDLIGLGSRRVGAFVAGSTGALVAGAVVALAVVAWWQVGTWRDTETLFRHATLVTDRNAFAHSVLGLELRRLNRGDEALAECRRGGELDPGDWTIQQNLSLVLIDHDKWQEAERHAREATRLAPGEATPHAALGIILAKQQNHSAAIQEFEAALVCDPAMVKGYLLLAQSLVATDRIAEATKQYQNVIELEPANAAAHAGLGVTWAKAGRADQAVTEFAEAVRLEPGNVPYRLLAAQNLQAMGKLNEAAEHARHILQLQPGHIAANLLEADALLATGQPEKAILCYRAVLSREAAHPTAANNLAWLLATTGNREGDAVEAIALAEMICQASAQQAAEPFDTLALAYAAGGRFEDAVRAAEQGIDLARRDKKPQLAEEMGERLKAYRAGQFPQGLK